MKEKEVVVKQKKEIIESKCQNCGNKVAILVPHKGDVLCGTCMKPISWTLKSG